MSEETPPDVANLQRKEDVDWLVARREKLDIPEQETQGGVDWTDPELDRNKDDADTDTDE